MYRMKSICLLLALVLVAGSVNASVKADDEPAIKITSFVNGQMLECIDYEMPFTVETNAHFANIAWEIINVNDPRNELSSWYTGSNYSIAAGNVAWQIVTPGEVAWYLYKGETYRVKVWAFKNPYYVTKNMMDAMADAVSEVLIVGTGVEREKMSKLSIVSFEPSTRTSLDGIDIAQYELASQEDNTVTVEFDGPVSSLVASVPQGLGYECTYLQSEVVDGTDNKVWKVVVPQYELAPFNYIGSTYTFNIQAKDAEGLYLDLDPEHSDHSLALFYGVGSGHTGIKPLSVAGDDKAYNLSGVRVSRSARGLVIIGGKKYWR